ncbi:hypothetical protein Hanom_Chr13g01237041 [Helianthus anomalus]
MCKNSKSHYNWSKHAIRAQTPTVTPQAAPQRSMASAIRATTSQPSSEHRIQRKTNFIRRITKNDQLSQLVEINTLKSIVEQQQTVIGRQQAEIDQLKAENVCLKAADEERERSSSILQKLSEDLKEGVTT